MSTICRGSCGQRGHARAAWHVAATENTPTHFGGLERLAIDLAAVGSTVAASGQASRAVGWGSGTVALVPFQASFQRKALINRDNSMKWNGGTVERSRARIRAHAGNKHTRACVRGHLSFHRSSVPERVIIKRNHGFAGGTVGGTVFQAAFQASKIGRLNTGAKL